MFLAAQIDWGDAPTWFGFAAAAVAAGFAGAGFVKLRQQVNDQQAFVVEQQTFIAAQRAFMSEQSATLALERQELLAVAEDRSSAQARQVRMVVGREDGDGFARIFNHSGSPIRGAEVKFGPYVPEAFEVHPHNFELQVGSQHALPVAVIGPGRVFEFWLRNHSAAAVANNRPTLEFTDGQSVRWSLDEHGELRQAGQ
ncbi:hypothetical protein ACFC26_16110 [Kitasatospora purpeofusca]|uniref:hypothetical protein n=1 Tax=Kitasatospora purpeofusca TaxID=67352 RepID=UPI0035E15365